MESRQRSTDTPRTELSGNNETVDYLLQMSTSAWLGRFELHKNTHSNDNRPP